MVSFCYVWVAAQLSKLLQKNHRNKLFTKIITALKISLRLQRRPLAVPVPDLTKIGNKYTLFNSSWQTKVHVPHEETENQKQNTLIKLTI